MVEIYEWEASKFPANDPFRGVSPVSNVCGQSVEGKGGAGRRGRERESTAVLLEAPL